MSYSVEDTIAAISTPLGEGGIAVVRISGDLSGKIADNIFRGKAIPSKAATYTVHLGRIIEPESSTLLDQVLLTVMWKPNSYTAEDVVEISSHGGPLLAQKILALCLQNGARPARPGEFTLRAFLNGKIDLAQAEAVSDLISSKTEISLRAAAKQLDGSLSRMVNMLGEKLKNMLALLNAYTDFPEEDLDESESHKLIGMLRETTAEMRSLFQSYDQGRILRQGLKVPIVGKPNVGKSSLFNRLLEENRTIVTEIPGTTRDTVSEYINIAGVPVELIDTAGMREAGDQVEMEGIRRTKAQIELADLVLALIDIGERNWMEDFRTMSGILSGKKYLLVLNKADLANEDRIQECKERFGQIDHLIVSSKTGLGLPALKGQIGRFGSLAKRSDDQNEIIITNVRHKEALEKSCQYLGLVEEGLIALRSYEFLAFDLKHALDSLEEIIGKTTPEEIIERIFAKFCIGK